MPVARRAGETVLGVRFHPGAGPAVLGPRASELRDVRVPLEAVWGRDGRELEERVAAASPADGLAVLQRQLRRRFHAAVGYGPKTLARVLRFQRLLELLDRPGPDSPAGARGRPSLATAAADAGYADQAHMTAECARLAGLTPSALLAERRGAGV